MKEPNSQNGFSIIVTIVMGLILFGVIGGVLFYLNTYTSSSIKRTQKEVNISPTPIPESANIDDQIWKDIVGEKVPCGSKDASGSAILEACKVNKVSGNYAKGTMPMAYWIAVKMENKWVVAVTGNGIPRCEEVDPFSIPKEIYGNCIEKSGDLRF